jgi:phosphohistidine swiveling domain-containing protein
VSVEESGNSLRTGHAADLPARSSCPAAIATARARELVLTGEWRHGLAMLKSSLEGKGEQAILDVLKGKSRLVDSSENRFDLVAEDPEIAAEFQAQCLSVFNAGRLMHDGRRYRAYGYVRDASCEIVDLATRQIQLGKARYTQLTREIGVHYMKNKRNDHAFDVVQPGTGRSVCVLFAPDTDAPERPSWIENPGNDPQRAVESQRVLPNVCAESDDDETMNFDPASASALRRQFEAEASLQPETKEDPTRPDALDLLRQNIAEANAREQGTSLEELSASLRARILRQLEACGIDEWRVFEMDAPEVGGKRTVSYPVVLALAFALSKTNSADLAPAWQPVSPPGLKMDNDDPLHSDLWLALGFDLNWTAYGLNHPDNILLQALASHLQRTTLGYQLHILTAAGQKSVSGIVRSAADFDKREAHEPTILLAPHAGEDFHSMAMVSKAVICQQGGKLAHLAIVGREMGIPIIRIDGAMSKFRTGMPVTIDLVKGLVELKR